MSHLDDLASVIELACLTEDRSPQEQRALLAVALDVDQRRGKFTVTNHNPVAPSLVIAAEPYDPSEGKPVTLSMAQAQAYNRLAAKWKPCETCGKPLGAHALGECSTSGIPNP